MKHDRRGVDVCFVCRITHCVQQHSLTAFLHGCHTKLERITTSNVPCPWHLNFLNSNLGSILHKTKWFSKKTRSLKTQDLIRNRSEQKWLVSFRNDDVTDNRSLQAGFIAASSQPLTLHNWLMVICQELGTLKWGIRYNLTFFFKFHSILFFKYLTKFKVFGITLFLEVSVLQNKTISRPFGQVLWELP